MSVVTVPLLCAVGLYASAFMALKARRAARGELREPSVVQTPRARLVAGIQNSSLGLVYYPCVAVASALPSTLARESAFLASLAAAAMSLVLAYSLLFKTRRWCPFCWTAHAVNWALPVVLWIKI